jgi:hypothetical protein
MKVGRAKVHDAHTAAGEGRLIDSIIAAGCSSSG